MRISDWSSDVCSSDLEKVRWKAESDSWPAFPTTRRAVLNTIIKNGVQNVVFQSGDIHCANVAAIEFTGSPAAQKLKAFSITSSAFRSEEHTSELQSLMRISYAVFCLKKKKTKHHIIKTQNI